MTVGQRIAALRKRRGWTQYDLAAELEVGPKTISCWERDTYAPPKAAVEHLARILGIPPEELRRAVP